MYRFEYSMRMHSMHEDVPVHVHTMHEDVPVLIAAALLVLTDAHADD